MFFERNLQLDILLLASAQKAGVKGYLLASSLGAYVPGKEINQEDDAGKELPWVDCGGAAKVTAEYHARCYREEHGMQISIVRPASTYGPWDDFWSEGATAVPFFVRQAAEGVDPLRISGDGFQVRDFIYSRDTAAGMFLAAKLGVEEPVNLGSGNGVSMRELIGEILANMDKKPEVIWDTSRPSGDRRRVLDTARAQALGFRPQIPLSEGIKRTLDWYREHRHESSGRYSTFSS
jgi:GDP-L-fucose synthase